MRTVWLWSSFVAALLDMVVVGGLYAVRGIGFGVETQLNRAVTLVRVQWDRKQTTNWGSIQQKRSVRLQIPGMLDSERKRM